MIQIFAIRMMVEEYLGKYEKLYVAFMDLEKGSSLECFENVWYWRTVVDRS